MKKEISKDEAEEIYRDYSNYIFRVALFLTKSKVLADDITQETFIKVFRKYYTFDSSKPLKPWIYKIALNVTRNTLRNQKWLKFVAETPDRECVNFVDSNVLQNEAMKELWEQVNRLNFKSKQIIVLHFYSEMKLTEISMVLGVPLGTCKSRLNTALNSLRKQFPQKDYYFIDGGNGYETT